MDRLLEPYAVIVDLLADYLGEHTEIVLHDLTDLEHSIRHVMGISAAASSRPGTLRGTSHCACPLDVLAVCVYPICQMAGRRYIEGYISRIVRRCRYGKPEPGLYLRQGPQKRQRRGKTADKEDIFHQYSADRCPQTDKAAVRMSSPGPTPLPLGQHKPRSPAHKATPRRPGHILCWFLLHSSALRVKVNLDLPNSLPAWTAVTRPYHQSSASFSKASGMGMRSGPKRTPLAFAAAIPSACR